MTDETQQSPAQTVSHATAAQIRFLQKHMRRDLSKAGYLTKYAGRANYPFIRRMLTAGFIDLLDPDNRFPYNWQGTRITSAGRAVIEQLNTSHRPEGGS